MPQGYKSMICSCGGEYRGTGFPGLNGTRDNFGVGKEFTDEKTGEVIDNWPKWERAGFQKPEPKNHMVKEAMKERIAQLKGTRQRQLKPQELPI